VTCNYLVDYTILGIRVKESRLKNVFCDIKHILTVLATRPRRASFHLHVTTKLHVAISHLLVRRTN